MKHFYIYRPTKNLCSFSVEEVRQGFYYIGEFESESDAFEYLLQLHRNLCETNNQIRVQLNIPQPIMDLDIFNNDILCWAFVHELELNAELTWAIRQKQLK